MGNPAVTMKNEEVTKDGLEFGYTTEDDGNTMVKKPLFNSYVMNSNCCPVVVCIRYYFDHLAEGDLKICTYIADVFT